MNVKEPGKGSLRLTSNEVKWLREKWVRIRKSQQTADSAGNDWNRINGEINRWMDESGVVDVVQRAKIKGESLALKDALESGKWHSAEAVRHIEDIKLFLRLKELEVL